MDRTFAFGSPLSVQQPASLGKIELVDAFDPEYLPAAGPAAFPMWVDVAWVQSTRGTVRSVVAVPPAFVEVVGTVEFRLHNPDGVVVRTLTVPAERFGPEGLDFALATARWPLDDPPPGAYLASARVMSRTGKPLTTVTPRLVSEAILSGR
jgi:hypothetical protein